jgi:hypothetical protein
MAMDFRRSYGAWRLATVATLVAVPLLPLRAQTLRDQLVSLFVFGSQATPLQFLAPADPNNPAAGVIPNDAFVPQAGQANATVLTFLLNWMAGTISSVPVGTTSGGATFRFERGVPVKVPLSRGPIYGERGTTLGRGRLIVGANWNHVAFTSVRGSPMSDIRLNFTHQDIGSGQCTGASVAGCNDVVQVRLSVDQTLSIYSLYATYGLLDRVDVGVLLPIVHNDLRAQSTAQVIPFGETPGGAANTFIAGTPTDPVLTATNRIHGSATGLGDMVGRVKVNLVTVRDRAVALFGDIRIPTGDEDELLGAGHVSTRILAAYSDRFGDFSPNASLGYLSWSGGPFNRAVLATVGFDQLVLPWATVALSLVGEVNVDPSVYRLPGPVTLTEPFHRTIVPAELPSSRDDALSVSIGSKATIFRGITAVVNTLFPVVHGGPRPDFVWTLGLERGF